MTAFKFEPSLGSAAHPINMDGCGPQSGATTPRPFPASSKGPTRQVLTNLPWTRSKDATSAGAVALWLSTSIATQTPFHASDWLGMMPPVRPSSSLPRVTLPNRQKRSPIFLLERAGEVFAERPAVSYSDARYPWREFRMWARRFASARRAAGLQSIWSACAHTSRSSWQEPS